MPKDPKDFFKSPKYLKVKARLAMHEDFVLFDELIGEAIIFGMHHDDTKGKEKKHNER